RHGGDVVADGRGVDDVQGVAHAGGQDLAGEVIVVEDGPDLPNDVHADVADVVQPPDERADEGRPGLGRQERLVGREDEGGVDPDPLRGGCLDRPQPLAAHRVFDPYVRGAYPP